MNRDRSIDLPTNLSNAPDCVFAVAPFAIAIDNTADLNGALPRLPGVNRNQKGLWRIGKTHRRHLARPKSRHSFELAVVIVPRSGNGEQPWL
jgi:hypothetical protein